MAFEALGTFSQNAFFEILFSEVYARMPLRSCHLLENYFILVFSEKKYK